MEPRHLVRRDDVSRPAVNGAPDRFVGARGHDGQEPVKRLKRSLALQLPPPDGSNVFAKFAYSGPGSLPRPEPSAQTPTLKRSDGARQMLGSPSTSSTCRRSTPREAVVAADGSLWRERYASVCPGCFRSAVPCPHFKERRLDLLLVGHNPSDHTWRTGYAYSNPSNHFWRLLVEVFCARTEKKKHLAFSACILVDRMCLCMSVLVLVVVGWRANLVIPLLGVEANLEIGTLFASCHWMKIFDEIGFSPWRDTSH